MDFNTFLVVSNAQHEHAQNIGGDRLRISVVIRKVNYRYRRGNAAVVSIICLPNGHWHCESVFIDVLSVRMLSIVASK